MSASQDYPFTIRDVVALLPLNVRRLQADGAYVDCPFCGDRRGRMKVNFVKNVWRCNHCDESGGMLALYGKMKGLSNGDAYREICDELQMGFDDQTPTGRGYSATGPLATAARSAGASGTLLAQPPLVQSDRASAQVVDDTLSHLFSMLTLLPRHREHLRSDKRGLTDEQISRLGFRSTPPPADGRMLAEQLMRHGCELEGVPGFYRDDAGYWTLNFGRWSTGILIPAVGMDGLLHGAQILLDVPMRSPNDPPGKGAKYVWFSSSNKRMGTTSGSPAHFAGTPFSRVVYVTEGLLKADIAHCLTHRSFIGIAGAGNVGQLDALFAQLARHGTEQIIEALDMDKFTNEAVAKGAAKIVAMAKRNGMTCQRLTWDKAYKGIDDWQLALRQKALQQSRSA